MKVIFHHPLPLDPNSKTASGIRPQRIIEALEGLGYEVDLVVGYAKERKRRIRNIKNRIRNGEKYDFMYAESSTLPTILTDEHRLPLNPLLDWLFFEFCKNNQIPIGLFYRDVYWKFENFEKRLGPIKLFIAKIAYKYELWVYRQTLTRLFLPSLRMKDYIPELNSIKTIMLPPGHGCHVNKNRVLNKRLKLFYVGGVSDNYEMHELFYAMEVLSNVELTICTRKEEWDSCKSQYPNLPNNIHIIHKSGVEMEKELLASDIALIFVKPNKYREFSSPFKLYEYLGYEKPIIASSKTLSGEFVEKTGVGWAIEYDRNHFASLVNKLDTNRYLLLDAMNRLSDVKTEHSWHSRALTIQKELKQ